ARNSDWESMTYGPCGPGPRTVASDTAARCVYIADTGDNEGTKATRAVYRLREPHARDTASKADDAGSVSATRLTYRYSDGPHDVEAMYVAPDASIYLITKRPDARSAGQPPRRALVFRLAPDAWTARGAQQAEMIDSLPIVPGSA